MSETGQNPRPPVSKHITQFVSRLATHHIELKDPDNPEAGNMLVPNQPTADARATPPLLRMVVRDPPGGWQALVERTTPDSSKL